MKSRTMIAEPLLGAGAVAALAIGLIVDAAALMLAGAIVGLFALGVVHLAPRPVATTEPVRERDWLWPAR